MSEPASMRVERGACTVNTEVNDIERRLAQLGYRMESSLAALDGEGHALIEIASGEQVDPPDDEVLELAVAWSEWAGVWE